MPLKVYVVGEVTHREHLRRLRLVDKLVEEHFSRDEALKLCKLKTTNRLLKNARKVRREIVRDLISRGFTGDALHKEAISVAIRNGYGANQRASDPITGMRVDPLDILSSHLKGRRRMRKSP